jgi:cytochrome c biogenesis protein CcmG/thiol:disulfide interchange protein DsbE
MKIYDFLCIDEVKMLKKVLLFAVLITIMLSMGLNAQDNKSVPSVKIKDLKGEIIDTKTFSNDGKPYLITFWATWCKPCIEEHATLSEVYPDWKKETGVKIFSVSIDDSRSSKKVAPFIKGRNWTFEAYLDENSDFKRAMNVNHPPHSFLVNGKGEIVWQHAGYAPGDEEHLLEEIKKLVNADKK